MYKLSFIIAVPVQGKKRGMYKVQYCAWFQTPTVRLGTYSPEDEGATVFWVTFFKDLCGWRG